MWTLFHSSSYLLCSVREQIEISFLVCVMPCLYVFNFCFQSESGWSGILFLIYYLDLKLKTR